MPQQPVQPGLLDWSDRPQLHRAERLGLRSDQLAGSARADDPRAPSAAEHADPNAAVRRDVQLLANGPRNCAKSAVVAGSEGPSSCCGEL